MSDVNVSVIGGQWQTGRAPATAAAHLLVSDRLFYTLPRELLDAIKQWATPTALDPDRVKLEYALADVCGRHDGQVGVWDGWPVWYSKLNSLPTLTEVAAGRPDWRDDPAWAGLDWLDHRATICDLDGLVGWEDQVSRGYCGWLASNLQFIAEHDAFFAAWYQTIRPRASMPYNDQRALWVVEELKPCVEAYRALCGRWQLAGLAGPYLPIPLGPNLPLSNPSLLPLTALAGGTLIYLPNTHPLPHRDRLRTMIEDALSRHHAPVHLKEWSDMVDGAHPGKSTIARYGRLFQLQHYWRTLHRRHGPFLKGHREDLMKAMVVVLFPREDDTADTKFDSVKKDVDFLSQRMGASDWYAAPCALDHF